MDDKYDKQVKHTHPHIHTLTLIQTHTYTHTYTQKNKHTQTETPDIILVGNKADLEHHKVDEKEVQAFADLHG